ncbi:phage tail protein [Gilliamella apicola]|uniref:phage tail protein n=1 Tax=Gilliamella apicola TaxID=1196095 RepID=UPI002FFB36FA
MSHIISWMQNNQPDALIRSQKHQQAIRFNVNYITDNQCDLTIELRLSERIKPTQKQEKTEFNLLTERMILQEP